MLLNQDQDLLADLSIAICSSYKSAPVFNEHIGAPKVPGNVPGTREISNGQYVTAAACCWADLDHG